MAEQIWVIENNELVWRVKDGQTHFDDIEMSGLYADFWVRYGVETDGRLALEYKCYFPTLRTIPNNTHATYCFNIAKEERPYLIKDGKRVNEYPKEFRFDGVLKIICDTDGGFTTERQIFPGSESKDCIELITVKAEADVELELSHPSGYIHSYGRGTKGVYVSRICNDGCDGLWLERTVPLILGYIIPLLLPMKHRLFPTGERNWRNEWSVLRRFATVR